MNVSGQITQATGDPSMAIAFIEMAIDLQDLPNKERLSSKLREATGLPPIDENEDAKKAREEAQSQEQAKQQAMQEMLQELEMAKQNGVSERVHFLGYVGGDEKSALYHAASVLVVSSRQEAMSIVALEAGICGTPVIVTDQCGFGEIKSLDPALEVPASAEGIANGLIYLLTCPGKREKVASSFRDFVSQRYTWDRIVKEYLHLYKELLNESGIKEI